MNHGVAMVAAKTAEIIAWEKRKRREQLAAAAWFYALVAAVAGLPFYANSVSAAARWLMPLGLTVLLAPAFLFAGRWRRDDSVRAVARADRVLRLEERALTAWELSQRDLGQGAAMLVFKQAGEKLAPVDPKKLFCRTWRWEALMALPLFVVWSGLVWFNPRLEFQHAVRPASAGLAQELRKFSRELQAKARAEKLSESLRLGQGLERLAQKGIESKTADSGMKTELARELKQFDAAGKSVADSRSFAAAESRQSLTDLKAELETARGPAGFPPAGVEGKDARTSWIERLAAMPQLQRRLNENGASEHPLDGKELQSFLERLDRQVTRELDRRELLDAEQILQRMMKKADGREAEHRLEVAGQGQETSSADLVREKTKGSLPGTEPGKNSEGPARLPEFRGGAPARLEGLLGAGESAGMLLKSQPAPGKSKVPQQEVIASYRREAEAQLDSERVPEGLKETVKQYFLSLGGLGGQDEKSDVGIPRSDIGGGRSEVGQESARGIERSASPDARGSSARQRKAHERNIGD